MPKNSKHSMRQAIDSMHDDIIEMKTRLDIVLVDHGKRIGRAEKGFIWIGLSALTGLGGLIMSLLKKGS